jgi:hypothetical protein
MSASLDSAGALGSALGLDLEEWAGWRLAPFEAVHPWWGRGLYAGFRGGVYANHTSIVGNANVMSAYRNARVTGGAVGMNTAGFGRGGTHWGGEFGIGRIERGQPRLEPVRRTDS